MTLDNIIDELAVRYGLSRIEAKDICETLFDDIKQRISKGERVKLTGLGTFSLKKQPYHRKRRDIPVDEDTQPWTTVYFKPAKPVLARVQRALIEEERIDQADALAFAEFHSQQQADEQLEESDSDAPPES